MWWILGLTVKDKVGQVPFWVLVCVEPDALVRFCAYSKENELLNDFVRHAEDQMFWHELVPAMWEVMSLQKLFSAHKVPK